MEPKTNDDWEMAEDTCEFVLDDGTVCGAHIGYGVRWLHLGRCDDHPEEDEDDVPVVTGEVVACSHSTTMERTDDPVHPWKCSDCGHVFGKSDQ